MLLQGCYKLKIPWSLVYPRHGTCDTAFGLAWLQTRVEVCPNSRAEGPRMFQLPWPSTGASWNVPHLADRPLYGLSWTRSFLSCWCGTDHSAWPFWWPIEPSTNWDPSRSMRCIAFVLKSPKIVPEYNEIFKVCVSSSQPIAKYKSQRTRN